MVRYKVAGLTLPCVASSRCIRLGGNPHRSVVRRHIEPLLSCLPRPLARDQVVRPEVATHTADLAAVLAPEKPERLVES
jgi:uncharacterized membrane-anchored protein YjiN (DUF445 family)